MAQEFKPGQIVPQSGVYKITHSRPTAAAESTAETQGRFSYVRDPCRVSRGTFGLADAQVPHSYVGTGKRCVAVSNGSRCRPRGRAPAALWTGDHRAYPVDTPRSMPSPR
jgi:hypothetical protein